MKTESFDRHPKTLNGLQIRAQSLSIFWNEAPMCSKKRCLLIGLY